MQFIRYKRKGIWKFSKFMSNCCFLYLGVFDGHKYLIKLGKEGSRLTFIWLIHLLASDSFIFKNYFQICTRTKNYYTRQYLCIIAK